MRSEKRRIIGYKILKVVRKGRKEAEIHRKEGMVKRNK
jgi:hypothetical protein